MTGKYARELRFLELANSAEHAAWAHRTTFGESLYGGDPWGARLRIGLSIWFEARMRFWQRKAEAARHGA